MPNRNALLICNTIYDDPSLRPLRSPLVDVEDLAAILEDPELGAFNVTSLINQEVQAARIAVARFCVDRKIDDVNLIYFSGHGIKDDYGRLFLAFKDTEIGLISATGLSGQFLLQELSGCRAKSNAVILDCAYAGAILSDVIVPKNVVILASSSATEYSLEEELFEQGQSRLKSNFSAGLIEGLKTGDADFDGDGTVTFNELFLYARKMVESATEQRQSPRIYDLTQKPVIAGKAARPIFVSYSRSDLDFASKVSDELRNGGHKIWMDTKSISGGDDWRDRISTAIDSSKLVLTVLSSEALDSSWVRRELSYADSARKPILPVFYKACKVPSWYELQFGHIQQLDLTEKNYAASQGLLLSAVKNLIQSRSL